MISQSIGRALVKTGADMTSLLGSVTSTAYQECLGHIAASIDCQPKLTACGAIEYVFLCLDERPGRSVAILASDSRGG